MILDGLLLKAITRELEALSGAKIEKIYQPERYEACLLLHTSAGKKRLVLSANPNDCRVQLTERTRENPASAPPFCMLLRKHIAGGRITGVEQPGYERVVHIGIDARDELGAPCSFCLIAEIMGKYSNLILTDAGGKVLDSIRRVTFDVSSVRQVFPGMPYELPPMNKYNPDELSEASLSEVIYKAAQTLGAKDALTGRIQGMSPQTADEILFRCFSGAARELSEERALLVAHEVKLFYAAARTPDPCLQLNADGLPVFCSVLPYETFSGGRRVSCASCNAAVDEYFGRRSDINALKQSRDALLKIIRREQTHSGKLLKIQMQAIEDGAKAEDVRKRGELITANIYSLKRGMESFECDDYYTGQRIRITLDSKLSPSQNAAKQFKRFNKLMTAKGLAETQFKKFKAELDYLEAEEYNITAAESLAELAQIRAALAKGGYIKEPPAKARRDDIPASEPMRFTSPDGLLVMVGKNSRQNDALTLRTAAESDVWLHAKNMPGSHVIIFTNGAELPATTLAFAASLAAFYSRGRQAGKVPVDYTVVKNVKKPSGAKAGMVIYDRYNTIMATPFAADAREAK